MSCNITNDIPKGIAKELRDVFGTNDTLFESHVVDYMSDRFQNHLKEKFKDKTPTDKEVADTLREYYNYQHPDINYSTQLREKDNPYRQFGYSSIATREFGKRLAANMALDIYHQLVHVKGKSVREAIAEIKKKRGIKKYSVKDYFAEAISHKVQKEFVQVAMRLGHSQEEVLNAIKKKDTHTINKWFENASLQDKNVLALFKESKFNSNEERQRFMSEVFRDSRLGECRIDNERQLTNDSTYEAIDEAFDEVDDVPQDDTNTDSNEDKDGSINNLNNKMGEYSTFMKHIDMSIKSYFNSLKKLHSGNRVDGRYDYNIDNDFGIADTMNAEQCVAVFYSAGDFTNVLSMIASARAIADSIPGFAAFHQFADYLEENQDFAFEVYRTFGKTVTAKLETIVDDGKTETNISNRRSDKLTALNYEYFNAIRGTSINTNPAFNLSKLDDIAQRVKKLTDYYDKLSKAKSAESKDVYQEEIDTQLNETINELTNLIKYYFPTVSEYTIANFVKNNKIDGEANPIRNLNHLGNIVRKLIKSTEECQTNYSEREKEISEINRHNRNLTNLKEQGEFVKPNDYKDVASAYAKEYIDKQTIQAVTQLASAFVQFTPVKTELNSRNVHGNQSSDVINNSMITNILKTLQSQLALENYGKYKFQSRQYDFSNIMVEHKDGDTYINYGLFRKEGNKFVPTEYAHRLLRARLFSGASDAVSSESVLYAEMSKGDYVATGFINFFNTPRDIVAEADTSKIPMANYFMRIPSDAPKNFIITAPKYSTQGLFTITNQTEVNRMVLERLNRIPTLTQEQMYGEGLVVVDEQDMYSSSFKQVMNHITSEHPYDIKLRNKKALSDTKAKDGDTVYVTCNYKSEDGIDNVYVLKGTLKEKDGSFTVSSPTLVGIDTSSRSADVQTGIKNRILDRLDEEGKINRTINTKHPIYQQFRQAFVQEVTDMASFINAIFETHPDGRIKTKNGEYLFRPGFANDAETARKLYKIYHTDGQSIFTLDANGMPKFTGAVFTSDRFTLHGENYGANILKAFDFFSTGEGNNHINFKIGDNGVEVTLTAEQEVAVEQQLSAFIDAYVKDTVARMEQYRYFIPEKQYTRENIEEFALNHHLAYISFNDLFEGNTKFYEDNQTFLKRAKETQGSGVPYGIVNYDMDMTAPMEDIPSGLDNAGFQSIDVNGNAAPYEIKLRSKFKGVTIKNTVRTGKTIGTFETDSKGRPKKDENGNYKFKEVGSLSKKLIQALRESGMTKAAAETKAANMMVGYTRTTVNDAQSYITFDEWVRRITARGQLPKYKHLIQAILDESKPLDAKTIGEFIQVQKNFYYDQHYNSELGVIAPRQIKNAEFVLVPRLIRGTQLEEVYNMMKEGGIDQLNTEETSKAGKCNVLTIWNNDGEITEENKADFIANAPNVSEEYSYNYLYTQQETPQHLNAENKAGIQIMKKIIDNIPTTSPLYPVKQKFFKLYSENIQASFQDIMKELGVKTDEKGNLKINEDGNIEGLKFDIFFRMLKDEVARLGLDSNMMDYVTLATEQVFEDASNGGKAITNMPTFLSAVNTKLENIAQSLFNSRITRQTLPGFHAAQITNIGFKPLSNQVSERSYSKELAYHPDEYQHKETGEVISQRKFNALDKKEQKNYKNIGASNYVEIMLPASNFGLEHYTKDGRRKTDEELLKELKDSGIDTMIGYRIPTEGKQSICVMKVVGFTDDALGSTIVVPDDWVSQTGSDFDIDSVYGIQFKGKYNSEGVFRKYEYHEGDKEGEAQRNGRNNELLQCMIDILSSNEALEENLSRSNFDDIIEARDAAIDSSVKRERQERSCYNFLDQADYQEEVMSGAKLKAFSVTRDTFCSICNTVQPTLVGNNTVSVIYREEDGYTLKSLKKSFNNVKDLGNGRFLVTHNTIGWSKDNKNAAGRILTAYSSQTTAHILDAVKEGAIPNVNDYTFQVYKLFPDIGSDYRTGIPFIMQNGVKRIVDAYNSNKSIYTFGGSNPIYTAIKQVATELLKLDGKTVPEFAFIDDVMEMLQRYNKELGKLFGADDTYKIALNDKETAKLLFDGNKYTQQLKSPSPVEKENLLFDLGVILQYAKLNNLVNTISSYARVCNPDKFGAKQSIFATNKVFDDIAQLIADERESKTITVGDKSFLEAIYPGLSIENSHVNIDKFIQNEDMSSAYPPLHYFLKYATATSIKINRNLFETQNQSFIDTVNSLRFAFSGQRKQMSEQTYKDFQNYILGRLYNRTTAVKSNVTYRKGEGFVFTDENLDKERRRIFGYGYNPNLMYTDANGNEHEFTVKDINNPTQEEIDAFASMTPAQKVMWIQSNFRESGIFKYLRSNLFNERKYRKTKVGAQEIEFIEGNEDIETIYHEFEKCFYNDNPLIALGALDIIKYGFMVEGFRMKKNAVYKVIKNSALMDSESPYATGIVEELNGMVHDLSMLDSNELVEDFVRSHSEMYQISSQRVNKVGKNKQFELPYRNDFMIGLDLTNSDDKAKAIKYELGYEVGQESTFVPNQYVKLRYDKRTILYKIVHDEFSGRLVAYPLNTLESTESGTWSANINNNIYMSEDYYADLASKILSAEDYTKTTAALIGELSSTTEEKKAYRFNNDMIVKKSAYSLPFDINDRNSPYIGGFEAVKDAVEKHFGDFPLNTPLIIRSRALADHISSGTVIQTINGRQYEIKPFSLRAQNNRYIGSKNRNHQVKERNPQVQAIMEAAQEAGYRVNDAFIIQPARPKTQVKPVTPNEMYSSIIEFGVNSMKAMARRQVSEGDRKAGDTIRRLEGKDIVAEAPSVETHLDEIIPTTAEYVQSTVNTILNDLEYFIQDEDGKWYNINSPETIDLIRNNPETRKRFLKTILDARAFVKNYRLINELDIDSEDEAIRPALRKIKEYTNKLQNATSIVKAEEQFALNYLSKLSTNPLIQGDIISMLDGYHSAGAFDAWVNDLQETSSPLLQIITKEVMGDIRAKELRAKEVVADFRKRVAEIEKRAKAAGHPINWKHIIDKNGKFIQNYNQDFVDEINRLRQDITDAKAGFDEGTISGIEKYLRAKLAYDKFKLKNTNQPLVDEYYQKRIKQQEHMLDKYTTIYCTYQKLAAKKRDILSHMVNGVLEESHQEKLKEVKDKMDELTAGYIYDAATGNMVEKYDINDPDNPFTGERRKLLSSNAAFALQGYLGKMSEIYDEYFTQEAKYGFEEELEKHLDTVNNYERRDANGRPTVPMFELLKHEDYVKSRDWLNANTRYVADEDLRKMINDAFKDLREADKANGGQNISRKILSTIARRLDAYDNHGIIDATKFSEKDIEAIRKEQEAKYGINESQPFSDRSLISCAPDDDTIFSAAFYKGMTSDGASNPEYIKKVRQINDVLKKYYDSASRTVETWEMSEADLRTLATLYDELEDIKKTKGSTNGKQIRKFIKEKVDFVYNEEEYNRNRELAITQFGGENSKGFRLWQRVNEQIIDDENGNPKVVPNRYIYGYAVPKGYKKDGSGDNTYVDKKKTDALRTIRAYTSNVLTEYYHRKFKEMQALGKEEFDKWYYANHIYNPHTHRMEPLPCWTKLKITPVYNDGEVKPGGEYVPAYNQLQSRPRNGKDKDGNDNGDIDARNPKYKEHASTATNFKQSADAKYHNTSSMTDEEREMKELFEGILRQNATTSSSQRFIDRGYMAMRAKNPDVDAKFIGKEAAKMLGWIEGNSGRESWYEHVDYERDRTIDMPMLSILKSKDSVEVPNNPPVREATESDADYKKRLDAYNKSVADAKAKNEKIHQDMLDDNWVSVMEEFITKAAHFNAIQDNKYMLFYAKNMIDKLDTYITNISGKDLFGGVSNLRRDSESGTGYSMKKDERLNEQFENWIRRLVYDQWKKPNKSLTRAANILQSLSSAKFMMLNITGAIANITVGEANIFGEVLAKYHFDKESYLKGKSTWMASLASFMRDMRDGKATSIGSAIVRFFNIIDFDEINGVVTVPDAAEYFKRARDLGFSPQTIGDHFMQNVALFSMLHSNRLVKNPNKDENGKTSWIYMTEAQFMNMAHNDALLAILNDEQKAQYRKFREEELKTPDSTKHYAWFRKDLATEFANAFLSNEDKDRFIEKRREIQKQKREEFNNDETHPTLMSQLKLTDDGRLGFKDDSILASLGNEAYDILGRFKGTAISVNKKIHGVYDKLGAAKWESYWWGGLVMQYHKHIYPGIMKRYRRYGYYNEERGTIEKGCYASLRDFLALPLHKASYTKKLQNDTGMSDAELTATQGIQNIIHNYVEFATNIRTNWNMIPESERSNIKRALGDFAGVLSALCLAIGLHCIGDADDEGLIYNLAMYEADRLASESFMYNPLGLYSEGKKLWSSPIAAQSSITDLMSICGLIAQYMLQGDEFDPYYQTGLYAGENKLEVKLKRNIPIYHSWNMLQRLNRSNKYYKLGDNMLSIVPVKDIANWIKD